MKKIIILFSTLIFTLLGVMVFTSFSDSQDLSDSGSSTSLESSSQYLTSSIFFDIEESAAKIDTGEIKTFKAEVWVDNWFSMYVNGELVGEDSIPITTERSFNSETFTFEAAYPFTLGFEVKDFKENDSGLEYIGRSNQQMGDGGAVAQITEVSTGDIVAVTDSTWKSFVSHTAPLDKSCEDSLNPEIECKSLIVDYPKDWSSDDFDDSSWAPVTVYSAADVDPKIGYDDIIWEDASKFIWGPDLEANNTVLMRKVIDNI